MARTGKSGGMVQDGGGQIKCMCVFTLNSRIFRALHKFYLVQCPVGRTAAGSPRIFWGLCVRHKGQGGGGADAGSVPGVGPPCQLVSAVDDIATALKDK